MVMRRRHKIVTANRELETSQQHEEVSVVTDKSSVKSTMDCHHCQLWIQAHWTTRQRILADFVSHQEKDELSFTVCQLGGGSSGH